MSVKIDQAFISAYIDADLGLDIAHENIAYSPTPGTEYVQLLNLPNDITPLSMTDSNETDGLFRIILYWPIDEGSIQAKIKADEIMAVFPIGTRVCYESQCVTVNRLNRQKGSYLKSKQAPWDKMIITIGYTAFIGR